MKKKNIGIQWFRYGMQVVFFIFFSGLFSLAFSGFKRIYWMMLNGELTLQDLFTSFLPVMAVILLFLLLGRFFCGWFCAFGTLNDMLYFLSTKIFKTSFSIKPSVDAALKYVKYILLVFIVYFVWTTRVFSPEGYNPWDAFAQVLYLPEAFLEHPVGFILFAGICIGAMFIERFFCRYICPLGAIGGILGKLSLIKTRKPSGSCGACSVCTTKCSMGIDLSKRETISSPECIECLKCVDACPRENIHLELLGGRVRSIAYGLMGIIVFSLVYVGGHIAKAFREENSIRTESTFVKTETPVSQEKVNESKEEAPSPNNGVAKEQKNTEMLPKSSEDGIGKEAIEKKSATLANNTVNNKNQANPISAKNTDKAKDTANAVNTNKTNAISKTNASTNTSTNTSTSKNTSKNTKLNTGTNTSPNISQNTSASTSKDANTDTNFAVSQGNAEKSDEGSDNKLYNDGVYEGVARGFRPNLTVSVTVKKDKIESIQILSHTESAGYYEEAFAVIPREIISAQSTQVDAVSGATMTSRGIMNAVTNALEKAKK